MKVHHDDKGITNVRARHRVPGLGSRLLVSIVLVLSVAVESTYELAAAQPATGDTIITEPLQPDALNEAICRPIILNYATGRCAEVPKRQDCVKTLLRKTKRGGCVIYVDELVPDESEL